MELVTSALVSHPAYLLAAAVAAYFCGCTNGAILTSRIFFHDDVRIHGSGNAGLTNFYRTYGAHYAALVVACDMLKAVAAVGIAVWLGHRSAPAFPDGLSYLPEELERIYLLRFKYWAGFFCLLGHMFPCTEKFKGGKGVLCSATMMLMLDWRIALISWGLFITLMLTTRYVSLGSVVVALLFPLLTQLVFRDGVLTVIAAIMAALVLWAHRENIRRLFNGTENKFHFHVKAPKTEGDQ